MARYAMATARAWRHCKKKRNGARNHSTARQVCFFSLTTYPPRPGAEAQHLFPCLRRVFFALRHYRARRKSWESPYRDFLKGFSHPARRFLAARPALNPSVVRRRRGCVHGKVGLSDFVLGRRTLLGNAQSWKMSRALSVCGGLWCLVLKLVVRRAPVPSSSQA